MATSYSAHCCSWEDLKGVFFIAMNSPLDFIACGHRVSSVFLSLAFPAHSHCLLLCPFVNMFVMIGRFWRFFRSVLSFIQWLFFSDPPLDAFAFLPVFLVSLFSLFFDPHRLPLSSPYQLIALCAFPHYMMGVQSRWLQVVGGHMRIQGVPLSAHTISSGIFQPCHFKVSVMDGRDEPLNDCIGFLLVIDEDCSVCTLECNFKMQFKECYFRAIV